MTTRSRWTTTALFLLLLALTACGVKLPPITIAIPPPATSTPKPEPPLPPVADPPQPPVEPAPAPDDRPLVNLNIVVHDATGAAIVDAACVVDGEARKTNPAQRDGFINFAVRGSVVVTCSAKGFVTRAADLPPGDHRFPLVLVASPVVTPPAEPPVTPATACSAAANRNGVSHGCLDAVAKTSVSYATCQITGAVESCHHYVREVVRALNASASIRWGLLKKTKGGDNVDGYGTDVIAYLPERFALDAVTWEWLGVDVIGGIGAPRARYTPGNFNPVFPCSQWKEGMGWCNRESDIWAPVPR